MALGSMALAAAPFRRSNNQFVYLVAEKVFLYYQSVGAVDFFYYQSVGAEF